MQFVVDASALIVDVSILYAVVMWFLRHWIEFPFPLTEAAKIFGVAFALQAAFYLIFSFYAIDINIRAYLVRASIIVVALSQAIPLNVAYHAYLHLQRKS